MEETEGETVRYIRGYRNRIIASDCESARQYYHYACDELGSVTHVVAGNDRNSFGSNSKERIQNTYEYDAFGNRTQCEEKAQNRFGYAGEQYDAVTQQYYLRARFYNPVIGRFTQEDSYHGDGLNLYAYCHNNPMYYVDPSGHDVRAAAEKNYVNKALDAMNGSADKGIDAMMKEAYGSGDGTGPQPNGSNGTSSPYDTPINTGTSKPRDNATPNSIYEQLNPDGTVKSRAFYDENGKQFNRQDFDHPHFDKKTQQSYQPHEHSYEYNSNGQPAGHSDGPLKPGYNNKPTK